MLKSPGIKKREVTSLSEKVHVLGKVDRTVSIAGTDTVYTILKVIKILK